MSIALYETQIHDLLYALTRSDNIEQVLKEVVELAKKSTDAEFSSLYLLENDKITHHILTSTGDFPEVARYKIQQSMKDGMAGWVYRHKQGALASDVTIDERWASIDNNDPFGSVVVVPLMIQNRVLAILTLGHSQKRFFREYHMAKAANFAERAAIIIENVRLTMRNRELGNSFVSLFNEVGQPLLIIDNDEIRYSNQAAVNELSIEKETTVLSESIIGRKIIQLIKTNTNEASTSSFTLEVAEGKRYTVKTSLLQNVGLGLLFSKI